MSRAARPLSNDEQKHLMETDKFPDWDWEPDLPHNVLPFEYKASDWGRLDDGRLVALDYALPVFTLPDDLKREMQQAIDDLPDALRKD